MLNLAPAGIAVVVNPNPWVATSEAVGGGGGGGRRVSKESETSTKKKT
jgi:hypothetical protein